MNVCASLVVTLIVFGILKPMKCGNSDSLEANRTTLNIADGSFIIKEFNVTYLNVKDKTVKYSVTGKIWHFRNEEDIGEILSLIRINQYYIFLIDDTETLQLFSKQTLFGIFNVGVIIPNHTTFISNETNDLIQTLNDSVFMYNDTSLDELIPYNITAETSNYFFNLVHDAEFFVVPFTYLKTLSIITFLIAIAIIVLWNLKIKYTPQIELYFLQKILIFLPYLNVIVCGLMIAQMFLAKDTKTSSFSDSRIYIETALITIRAIFRTMFWFLIVLVSSGWQITTQKLSREKIKLFIKVFVFIYVTVCVDQIIDSFTGHIFVIVSHIYHITFIVLPKRNQEHLLLFNGRISNKL